MIKTKGFKIRLFVFMFLIVVVGLSISCVRSFSQDKSNSLTENNKKSETSEHINILKVPKPDLSISDEIKLVKKNILPSIDFDKMDYLRGKFLFCGYDKGAKDDFPCFIDMTTFKNISESRRTSFGIRKSSLSAKGQSGYITNDSLFDPQFSPDGKYFTFKFGDFGLTGVYRLYVYDIKDQRTYLVSKSDLNYYAVSWSPDSKYIAFAKGGEIDPRLYFYGRSYDKPLQLCIANWKTGKTYNVVTSGSLRGDWEWIAPHTLIYGDMDQADVKFRENPNYKAGVDFADGVPIGWERLRGQPKKKPVTSKVYEYSIEKQDKELLFDGGYHPHASADGKHVAYFGWKNEMHPMYLNKEWKDLPSGQYLIVKQLLEAETEHSPNKLTDEPRIFGQFYRSYPYVTWLPDNQHMLISEIRHESESTSKLVMTLWNIQTGYHHAIATLTTKSAGDIPVFYEPIVSSDGKHVTVIINEYYPIGTSSSTKIIMKEVNLSNGNIRDILQMKGTLGASWTFAVEEMRQ